MNRGGEEEKENEDEENEAAEDVYTDEQLNEIISRTDYEFELF